jgi:hypothetical protein
VENGQFCIAALQHGSIAPCRFYEAARQLGITLAYTNALHEEIILSGE